MAKQNVKLSAAMSAWLTCIAIPAYADIDVLTKQDELNIKLRAIYFDRDYENNTSDDSTFAQGIEINYKSGMLKV